MFGFFEFGRGLFGDGPEEELEEQPQPEAQSQGAGGWFARSMRRWTGRIHARGKTLITIGGKVSAIGQARARISESSMGEVTSDSNRSAPSVRNYPRAGASAPIRSGGILTAGSCNIKTRCAGNSRALPG